MKETVQLGIRVDKNLLKRIERLAHAEGIDKMDWIRRSLTTFLDGEEEGVIDAAIDSYLELRIDEHQLLKCTGFKKVPKDLCDARKICLEAKMKGKKNG